MIQHGERGACLKYGKYPDDSECAGADNGAGSRVQGVSAAAERSAGISYKLHIGSNSRMHMIRTATLSTTARSGVNSPEKKSRNKTIVKIKT